MYIYGVYGCAFDGVREDIADEAPRTFKQAPLTRISIVTRTKS